jgi:hypothetical protein
MITKLREYYRRKLIRRIENAYYEFVFYQDQYRTLAGTKFAAGFEEHEYHISCAKLHVLADKYNRLFGR